MKTRLIGGAATILLMLGGCANPGTTLEWISEPEQVAYTLDAGDQVRVIVIDEPQLSGEFVVDTSGSLSIPTVARVPAKGRTAAELEEAIRNALESDQIRDPEVAVQITAMRRIFILGEVASPGSYPYAPDMSVLTAVATAGGFTSRAQSDFVSITRREGTGSVERRARRSSTVLPGDVIFVFERVI